MLNENNESKGYYKQNLGKLWSYPEHYKCYEHAQWKWGDFPFSNNLYSTDYNKIILTKKINDVSIMEVGSAMGAAYNFLKTSNLVDLKQYTGIEVSSTGHEFCIKNYKEANWIKADFTNFIIPRKVDYAYERISVHHMPEPLKQYDKILSNTNIAASFSFRGCIEGETISNLDNACFFEIDGRYFCNIINIFDVVELGKKNGFNDIRILYGGLHEPFIRNLDEAKEKRGNPYISKNINVEQKLISRFQIRLRKNKNIAHNKMYLTGHPKTFLKHPLIILRLLKKIRDHK